MFKSSEIHGGKSLFWLFPEGQEPMMVGEAWELGAGAGSRETTSSNTIVKQKYEAVSSWGIVNHTVNPKFVFVLIN